MRDNTTPVEPARDARVFQQPSGYDHTPTEQLPALGDQQAGRLPAFAAPGDRPLGEQADGRPGGSPRTAGWSADRHTDGHTDGDPAADTADTDGATDRTTEDTDRDAGQTTGTPGADSVTHRRDGQDPDSRADGRDADAPVTDTTADTTAETPVTETPVTETPTAETPVGRTPTGTPATGDTDAGTILFGDDVVTRFRGRWRELQSDFVDDPKRAVRGADELVDEVMRTLSETLTEHKHKLEGQWQNGPGDTEELRLALRKYRSFFDQLLNT